MLARHDRPAEGDDPPGDPPRPGGPDAPRLGDGGLLRPESLQAYAVFGWIAKLYRDAGFTATDAGLLLGLITGIGIPLSFAIPTPSTRPRAQLPILAVLTGCYLVGYLGCCSHRRRGLAVGIAGGRRHLRVPADPDPDRAARRTPAGTAALSGFTQSVGYLIGATGPFAFGLLHDLTDGWTVPPLLVLMALLVPLVVAGVIACRSGPLEANCVSPRRPPNYRPPALLAPVRGVLGSQASVHVGAAG